VIEDDNDKLVECFILKNNKDDNSIDCHQREEKIKQDHDNIDKKKQSCSNYNGKIITDDDGVAAVVINSGS